MNFSQIFLLFHSRENSWRVFDAVNVLRKTKFEWGERSPEQSAGAMLHRAKLRWHKEDKGRRDACARALFIRKSFQRSTRFFLLNLVLFRALFLLFMSFYVWNNMIKEKGERREMKKLKTTTHTHVRTNTHDDCTKFSGMERSVEKETSSTKSLLS